ncbi:MAG: arsenic-transporting ATPase [Micrococcales bacterium]|nr:MAG: arsenic-transporting ATPase [Micrococcales bacterium]
MRGLEIDPRRTTDAHIDAVRHTLQRLMPEHLSGEIRRHLELAREAPGTHEAALLERLAEVIENRGPDELVVVDTAPSGHTARLLALPELMQAWTDGLLRSRHRSERFGAALRGLGGVDTAGRQNPSADRRARRDREIRAVLDRRRERFCRLRTTLQDARRTAFVIVLAAERVPVQESIELHDELLTSGLHVAGLVANKLSPADAGPLLAARHRQERPQLDQLRARLPGLPVVEIPLLAGEVAGASGVGLLTPYL